MHSSDLPVLTQWLQGICPSHLAFRWRQNAGGLGQPAHNGSWPGGTDCRQLICGYASSACRRRACSVSGHSLSLSRMSTLLAWT
jgi:hypothetical protein